MQADKLKYLYFPAFLIALVFIYYGVSREETTVLLCTYGALMLLYGLMLKQQYHWLIILGTGIICRLTLFGQLPSLSDDFYRFLWDGELFAQGVHPFEATPDQWLEKGTLSAYMRERIYPFLNSPGYFTVYPPLAQYIFAVSAWFSEDISTGVTVLRTILLAFEIGTMLLVYSLSGSAMPRQKALLAYALNPLVILEIVGNVHLEGAMLFFVLLMIYLLQKNRLASSGLALGAAISTKIIPLAFMPVFIFKKIPKKWFIIMLSTGATIIILAWPLLDTSLIVGLQESLSLFVKKFEFNASFYFITRELGFWVKGYNIIGTLGPWLSILTMLTIVVYSYFTRKSHDYATQFLFIWMIYLAFASIVHPWYIIPMIGLSLLTPYRFPLLWSGLIFLSYAGYGNGGYTQPYGWIAVEYIVVYGYLMYELFDQKKLKLVH